MKSETWCTSHPATRQSRRGFKRKVTISVPWIALFVGQIGQNVFLCSKAPKENIREYIQTYFNVTEHIRKMYDKGVIVLSFMLVDNVVGWSTGYHNDVND